MDSLARFEKEIGALSSLVHPHIAKMHNVSFSDGYYFLVSECIVDSIGETTNLAQYLSVNKQNLNENEVLELLSQIAAALDYAHQKHIDGVPIAHRGMKLNNILIGKGKRGLHIYLSDFGLSRIIGEGAILTKTYQLLAEALSINAKVQGTASDKFYTGQIETSKLSKLHASFLQTYSFLAPEQKIYRETPVGPQADIYALGVLAYFLLMRSYPEGVFTMPSQAFPDYRLNWDDFITSCLQADPNKRAQTGAQAIDTLLATPAIKTSLVERSEREVVSAPPIEEEESNVAVMQEESEAIYSQPSMINQVSSMIRESQPQPILKPQEITRPTYEENPAASLHVESTVGHYQPEAKEVENIEPILSEMAVVKGGDFLRGSNDGGRG